MYRVLQRAGICYRRGRSRAFPGVPGTPLRSAPQSAWANRLWSCYFSPLPTAVRGVCLYLYLFVDIWIREVEAWDVSEVESA